MTKNELENALSLCVKALNAVKNNQQYQKLSGAPHFTSAPTEWEYKRDSQRETDEIVEKALREVNKWMN